MNKQILLPLALIAASLMTGCTGTPTKPTPVSDQPPATALKTPAAAKTALATVAPINQTISGLNYYPTALYMPKNSGMHVNLAKGDCIIGVTDDLSGAHNLGFKKIHAGFELVTKDHACNEGGRLNGVHSVQYITIEMPSRKKTVHKVYTSNWVDGHMQGKAIVRTVQGKKTVTMKNSQITG